MKNLFSLNDILSNNAESEELYTSEQRKKYKRKKSGYFTSNSHTFDFIFLLKSWGEIVGQLMAKNSIPLKIKNKTLYVSTKHQVFAQEMSFLIPEILNKIYAKFPDLEEQVKQIKFINNEFTLEDFNKASAKKEFNAKKPQKLHPFSPEYKKREFMAEQLFGDLEDQELKEALVKFYLNW